MKNKGFELKRENRINLQEVIQMHLLRYGYM